MKQGSTTPTVSKISLRQWFIFGVAFLIALSSVSYLGSTVLARNYDAEIEAKRREASQYSAEADKYAKMADTLQGEIDSLNRQITTLQGQIAESERQHKELEDEIDYNEELIEQNRNALGEILSDMHVDDQISPLEMLASSDSIGDYIDKQEQRSTLRSSLNDKIKEIKVLQAELEEKQKEVESVLADQNAQRNQVATKQSEQSELLAITQNDQSSYEKLAAQRNAEITQLQQQQVIATCQAMGGAWVNGNCQSVSNGGVGVIPPPSSGNGGYPAVWANARINAYVDNWGLYSRQCVSYTAWKVHSTGRHVPHFQGMGNANQWPSTVARHGIKSGSEPRAGSVAMLPVGYYGHTMYVESVNGDGTITVSDYNLAWDGAYRLYTRSAAGLTYIYF